MYLLGVQAGKYACAPNLNAREANRSNVSENPEGKLSVAEAICAAYRDG